MTLRLLFLLGLSGLLVLDGCGGGGDDKKASGGSGGGATSWDDVNDAAKMEAGCNTATTGCCVTRAYGGREGARCKGSYKRNRTWACSASPSSIEKYGDHIKDKKDGCTIEECEKMCTENTHMPTPDGGTKCINYIFGYPGGKYDKQCMLYSSCEEGFEAKADYITYHPAVAGAATSTETTSAP